MRRIVTLGCVLVLALPATGAFVSAGAQAPTPREVALIVDVRRPADTAPLFGADAKPSSDAPATIDTIRRDIAPLAGEADLPPFAIKVSPTLCDELHLLDSAPARALLADIERLASGQPTVSVPYTDVRLGDIDADALPDEIAEGVRAVSECTKRDPIGLLAVSDLGVPDDDDLRVLARDGPRYVLSGYAFPPRAASERGPYAVAATTVTAGLDVEDVLAERPGAGELVVVVDVHDAAAVMTSLAADERIDLRPLSSFLRPDVDFREGPLYEPEPLSARYLRVRESAHEALDDFDSYTFDDNRLTSILRTELAEAGATADARVRNTTETRLRLEAIAQTIRRQFGLVSLNEGSVTFTSRRGSVPVTVTNKASYPVKVRVSLQSSKLSFPKGRTIVRKVEPPGDTVTFTALAKSSGAFPLTAVLKSPRAEITLDSAEFTVRSTAANLPVLILTVAGALLLLVVYAGRVGRRRREPS